MTRTKVLFVAPCMGLGGSERVLLHVLRSLSRDVCEPHLALLTAEGHLLDSVPEDVPIHTLRTKRARYAIVPFARLCWKLRPDVVFSLSAHLNSAVLASRCLLPGGVQLFTREGTSISTPEAKTSRWRLLVYGWLYRHADAVVCQSDAMREQLIHAFRLQSKKAIRLYNPVDIELVSQLAEAQRNPLPFPGPNLVAVGRLATEKGFDLLLDAMALIHAALPGVMLTIVGDGPLEGELNAQRKRLGLESCVHLAGCQNNPYPYLRHADAVVLSSRYEGLPNVVLEALALRTPVVSTNSSAALREISSTTSLLKLAAENSAASLAAEVLAILKHPSPERSPLEAAFVERFGLRNTVRSYEQLLTNIPEEQARMLLHEHGSGISISSQ